MPEATFIYNVNPDLPELQAPFSIGVHPWFITPESFDNRLAATRDLIVHPLCVAVGECGIDKNRGAELSLQKEMFRRMVDLSETYRKPMIIHCVKGFDEIFSVYKEKKPQQPWIIHGFRGKPDQAYQLLKAGMMISLGDKFNPETARIIPVDKLFVETDESPVSVQTVYQRIASIKGISETSLAEVINRHAERLFGIE